MEAHLIEFDLSAFLKEQLLSIEEVAKKTRIPVQTLYSIKSRGTIKPQTLRHLCEKYGLINKGSSRNIQRAREVKKGA